MTNLAQLPTGHKFVLYRDEDGDYVLESQQEIGMITDGVTLDEAISKMVDLIPKWGSMSELARGYVANARDALKLCREFEGAQLEVLSRSEL